MEEVPKDAKKPSSRAPDMSWFHLLPKDVQRLVFSFLSSTL